MKRAAFKFSGRQRIAISWKYGFTNISRKEYFTLKKVGGFINQGGHVQVLTKHGPLKNYLSRLQNVAPKQN